MAIATPDGDQAYYNVSQAAAKLGVSRVSIWRWIRDGELSAARIGHRTTRICREDVDNLMQRLGAQAEAAPNEHFVQFYEDDEALVEAVAGYIAGGLKAGGAGMVIAARPHRRAIAARLKAKHGLDVAALQAARRYAAPDAQDTLAAFMVQGMPDPARFRAVIGAALDELDAGDGPIHAFGEMVALLAMEGNQAGTIRLEELWNELQAERTFALFCGYPMACLHGEALAGLLGDVSGQHARVVPAESFAKLRTADQRSRAVASLQQQAASLATEVGQRKEAERQLEAALDTANAALRARDEFLSIAAHELKTPLTSVKGHVQLALRRLQRGDAAEPEQLAEALRMIDDQTGKLARLVSQLFDVSQLDAGKLAINPLRSDLAALVRQVVDNARLWGADHPIRLDAPASAVLRVDALRLEQVLANLLDNAIKYSPAGAAIEVALTLLPDAAELAVRDHGRGIPADQRAHIFERFYQAQGSEHRGGMGLGLYVSRQIAELHGGAIRAEFPEDGGSRFVLTLPRGEG